MDLGGGDFRRCLCNEGGILTNQISALIFFPHPPCLEVSSVKFGVIILFKCRVVFFYMTMSIYLTNLLLMDVLGYLNSFGLL